MTVVRSEAELRDVLAGAREVQARHMRLTGGGHPMYFAIIRTLQWVLGETGLEMLPPLGVEQQDRDIDAAIPWPKQ